MVIETVSSGIGILKGIWDSIKGTRKIRSPENKEILENSEIRNDFLNNNPHSMIINIQGGLYIGDSAVLNSSEKRIIKDIFSEENKSVKKQIDIIESDFYERIKKLKSNIPSDKKLNPFVPFLEPEIKNILSLSIYAKKLFDSGDSREAKKIREDIGGQYGKDGRKLCNLYLSGYIDGMTEYLEVYYGNDIEKTKSEINNKIKDFVKNSKYIIFIHSESIESEVKKSIEMLINRGEDYIAIHGAGSNISKVRKIIESLKDTITRNRYDLNEENLKTLSLCPLLNVCLTKKE